MRHLLQELKSLQPEVDYQALMAQMPHQSHPRRKLKELQNKGYLVRLKKGFYVFSSEFLGRNYSPEIVANLMHGPSYLSLEYALAFYQLIPERVETYTSVTSQKNKTFQTTIGTFSYRHLAPALYPVGVTVQRTTDDRQFVMATPEKALLDLLTLRFEKGVKPTTKDLIRALEEDLRLDVARLFKLAGRTALEELRTPYRNRAWGKLLIQFLLENV
jgi:predicted transcriptional regulator of viral defense system